MALQQTIDSWWKNQQAQALIKAELNHLALTMEFLKGDSLLIFGDLIPPAFFQENRSKQHIWYYGDKQSIPNAEFILGEYNYLPFLTDSIDNIILPHILDIADAPKVILKEIWRTLVPEGHVAILGFNSYSMIGLPKSLQSYFMHKSLLQLPKLKTMLLSQGFIIERFETFCFLPRFLNKQKFLLHCIEMIGSVLLPAVGCVYILIAKKPVLRLLPMTKLEMPKKLILPKGSVVKPSVNREKI